MRKRLVAWCSVFVLGLGCIAIAQAPAETAKDQFAGTWSGTWDGAGSGGGFELTLEQAKPGAWTGKVSVTGEPEYKAVLKSVSFEGPKMTAKYDFPPEPSVEVTLTATFEGKSAKGTWALRGDESLSGTWTVTKKN